ncbi:MAG TPA: hypothetical protein VNS34_06140 [Rhizobiaceae bacterium]|nr:hypothetical protein [Rhizobiaceae bacterium]
MSLLEDISASLGATGLILRGGFNFDDGDHPPPGPSGRAAKSVVLVGHAGASHWPYFKAWLQKQPGNPDDPLDRWSRDVIDGVARKHGARAVSPSDRPYLPFQQWAMRAEGLQPSPLGILMHPVYGLWHAYRGALLLEVAIDIGEPRETSHLCGLCVGKPCLKSCPAGAHSQAGFAYDACLAHLRSKDGQPCLASGCFDRNACPHGTSYRYPEEMQAFHMRAFAA